MKNIVIDNQRVQFPNQNKTKKTHLEVQIAELQQQEQQISQQLKTWQAKLKKVNNLANCLAAANKFAQQFLTAAIEKEKNQEQPDDWAWEYLIKNRTEFALKFEAGKEAFTQLVLEKVEGQTQYLGDKLSTIRSQIQHQERKFARLQARRQGKTLLDCEYNKPLGCLGEDWCDNCQVNYPTTNQVQAELKGGAC